MTAARAAAMDGLAVMNRGSLRRVSVSASGCGRGKVVVIQRRRTAWVLVVVDYE